MIANLGKNLPGVLAYLLGDCRHRLRFRSALVLDRGADHASGIGDEIRYHQHILCMKSLLGRFRGGNVGALDNKSGLDIPGVGLVDDVRARSRDKDVASRDNHSVPIRALGAGIVGDGISVRLQFLEARQVETIRQHCGPAGIGDGNDASAFLNKMPGGVPTDRAETLDCNPSPIQRNADEWLRHLGRDGNPKAGGPDLIQRNAANHARQADRTTDFVADPCHTDLVGAHVRAGDVIG